MAKRKPASGGLAENHGSERLRTDNSARAKNFMSKGVTMDIKHQIRQYIATDLLFSDNGFKYDDDASFLQESIVDSLGVMDLVLFIEETFGVTVEDHDLTPDNFDSVNRLANFVQTQLLDPASRPQIDN